MDFNKHVCYVRSTNVLLILSYGITIWIDFRGNKFKEPYYYSEKFSIALITLPVYLPDDDHQSKSLMKIVTITITAM